MVETKITASTGQTQPLPLDPIYQPEKMNLNAPGFFRPLSMEHPDYQKDLQDLTLALNEVFVKFALERNLAEKAKTWTKDNSGHVAAVGTPYGMHLAFCRRIADPEVRLAIQAWIEAREP